MTASFAVSLNAEAVLGTSYMAFLQNLLFYTDEDGNQYSRLYEKVIVEADPGTDPVLTPIKLTTNQNNGGTEELGYTSGGDDTIVAGRLELLQGAYIDAGTGYDILEIDAKGTYAQPKALLNIEEIRVQNMANVYTYDNSDGHQTTGDDLTGSGHHDDNVDVNGYLNNSTYPYLAPYDQYHSITSSFIDLTRATSIEKLVVNEAAWEYNPYNYPIGDLTIIGVRNGATLRL
jgi:hypothetical protein